MCFVRFVGLLHNSTWMACVAKYEEIRQEKKSDLALLLLLHCVGLDWCVGPQPGTSQIFASMVSIAILAGGLRSSAPAFGYVENGEKVISIVFGDKATGQTAHGAKKNCVSGL